MIEIAKNNFLLIHIETVHPEWIIVNSKRFNESDIAISLIIIAITVIVVCLKNLWSICFSI